MVLLRICKKRIIGEGLFDVDKKGNPLLEYINSIHYYSPHSEYCLAKANTGVSLHSIHLSISGQGNEHHFKLLE